MGQWSDSALKAWYYALLGAAVLVGTWLNIEPYACPVPDALLSGECPKHPPCFEFWLNRYQTFVGALAAIAAAAIAWLAASRQISIAREQVRAAVGDLEPDLFARQLTAGFQGETFTILVDVTNHNRREIALRRVELIAPADASGVLAVTSPDQPLGQILGGRMGAAFDFFYRISGTRPSAPEASNRRFLLTLTVADKEVFRRTDRVEIPVRVAVEYEIAGAVKLQNRIALECIADNGRR